jgi:arylformamidase
MIRGMNPDASLALPLHRPQARRLSALASYFDDQYNNRIRVPQAPELFERWTQRSAEVRAAHPRIRELGWGPDNSQRLDLFSVKKKDRPLVVFIHGGYWRSLDKDDFSFIAPAFEAANLNLAVVNYPLAPAVSIKRIVQSNLASLAWLYRNGPSLGFDRSRIVVVGHSAGGHLAAMMLAAQWPSYGSDLPRTLVRAIVPLSGLFDLTPIQACPYLNVDLKLSVASAQALSPSEMPPAHKAPVLLGVGGLESDEFLWQTRWLAHRWAKLASVSSVKMPGLNHFTVCEQLEHPESPLFKAIRKLIKAL